MAVVKKIIVTAGTALVLSWSVALPSASADAGEKPNAEELTNQAYEHYKKGAYPLALSTYQRAYQLSAATPILFNIANIYDRRLHERELASEYYRRYLRASDVEPDLVRRASERLEAMKEEAEAIRRNGQPPATTSDAASPASHTSQTSAHGVSSETPDVAAPGGPRPVLRTAGYVTAGTGVVALAVGAVFGAVAMGKNDEAASMCTGSVCTSARALDLTNDARSAAGVSTAAFVVGGVLAAGGVAMVLFAPGRTERSQDGETVRKARLEIGPFGATIRGEF